MKTKIIAIITILVLTFTMSNAKNPEFTLQQTIYSQVKFPKVAIEKQIEGIVFVEFTVKEDGKIEVINCASLQGELQSYIFQTLSEITVMADPELTGKTFLMKFDFKLS